MIQKSLYLVNLSRRFDLTEVFFLPSYEKKLINVEGKKRLPREYTTHFKVSQVIDRNVLQKYSFLFLRRFVKLIIIVRFCQRPIKESVHQPNKPLTYHRTPERDIVFQRTEGILKGKKWVLEVGIQKIFLYRRGGNSLQTLNLLFGIN